MARLQRLIVPVPSPGARSRRTAVLAVEVSEVVVGAPEEAQAEAAPPEVAEVLLPDDKKISLLDS